MLAWLFQRFRRPHEPEVQKAQTEQKRKFNEWQKTLSEVARVEKLAQKRHSAMHRPR